MGADLNVRNGKPISGLIPSEPPQSDSSAARTSYPIHFAASGNSNVPDIKQKMILVIQALLKGGANPFMTLNEHGDTILHNICEFSGIIVPFLDLPNLDLESRDSQGRTLLLAACGCRDGYSKKRQTDPQATAVQLLEKGADITAIDSNGRNHFITSVNFNWVTAETATEKKTAEKKLREGAPPTPEPVALVQKYIDHGVDINARNSLGETILFPFLGGDPIFIDIVRSLVEQGADLTVKRNDGQRLLHVVAQEYASVFELKIVCEAQQNAVEEQEAMREGLEMFSVDAFKYLMEKGLDPMMEDNKGKSALDCATASSNADILKLFKREE
ncbi:uncharacterized protein BP5553_06477 [Venustampulla echinocandica]|uniref:Uncharacterized protein n=1 Tax=Venustampulla echinocandica TaxID=2656787 RepID=A0A370TK18_9HELO|nr:uncharacterized protein BP5553_06477 [Venustampulla echinocandica]RDL35865.1 hypothetical protein BP5553_06477 [Venustampulla echinocandica]